MRNGLGGVALAVVSALGCGGTKAAVVDSGLLPTPDASHADAAADAIDAAMIDTAVPPTGRPLPAGVRAPARLLDGTALLMGNDKSACTHQTPASGDGHRWCAVTIGRAVAGLGALWVIDVTRAATGDVPRCDGTDAGCLRLTDKVFTHAATFFDGDTLIYGTDSVAAVNTDFMGRFFAWRPGWTAGRQISSDKGFTCIGNAHSAAAACFDDPLGNPAKRDSANVRAGMLDTQTGGALPTFGRYPLRNDNNTTDWQAGFSPDGSVFVLSDADTRGARQTLRLLPTRQVGVTPPPIVLQDVLFWEISNDDQKIYFQRNPHGQAQLTDMYVADFPSGANQTLVEIGISGHLLIGDRPGDQALELRKDHPPGGTIELLSDRNMPGPKAIFTYDDFLNGAVVSPDLRYTTWLNDPFLGVVFRNSDLATCSVNDPDQSPISDISYLQHASLMFWKEVAAGPSDTALRDAYYAPPETCRRKARFAQNADQVTPVGDRGLVLVDEEDDHRRGGTLKYIAVAPGGAALDPAGAVRVHDGVGGQVVLVGAEPPLLVYAVTGPTDDTSGIYVFGPVPF